MYVCMLCDFSWYRKYPLMMSLISFIMLTEYGSYLFFLSIITIEVIDTSGSAIGKLTNSCDMSSLSDIYF